MTPIPTHRPTPEQPTLEMMVSKGLLFEVVVRMNDDDCVCS